MERVVPLPSRPSQAEQPMGGQCVSATSPVRGYPARPTRSSIPPQGADGPSAPAGNSESKGCAAPSEEPCSNSGDGGDWRGDWDGKSPSGRAHTASRFAEHPSRASVGLSKGGKTGCRKGVSRLKSGSLEELSSSSWMDQLPEAPVFRPTREEFADPLAYISSIRAAAEPWGICKIVPPLAAAVPGSMVLLQKGQDFHFTTRGQVLKRRELSSLDQLKFYSSGKEYSIISYERVANEFSYRRYNMAGGLPSRYLESEYWREWSHGPGLVVEYGNDVEGTAFSNEAWDPLGSSKWNCANIPMDPGSALRLLASAIPGVTTPMLYIGMLFSTFAWHVEDVYLYSINYHHFGAPKTWYGVPGSEADSFEKVVMDQVYSSTKEATSLSRKAFEREAVKSIAGKTTMFSPSDLLKSGVRVSRCLQLPGEFVVTFPRSYHAGFSHGFNCGEAVNFGTRDWFPFGLSAGVRYSNLRQAPIMSPEELLFREAMELHMQEKDCKASDTSALTCGSRQTLQGHGCSTVKAAFTRLMMWQNSIRQVLVANGATCSVMPSSVAWAMRHTPCVKCSCLLYLAAVRPPASDQGHTHNGSLCCLRCAKAEADRNDLCEGMLVMCHPGLEAAEKVAQTWQRSSGPVCCIGDDKDMDRGRSGLLDEPVWWDVGDSASPVCAEYEWAKDLPECSSWDVKAWESCAEFQVPAQRPSGSNLPATKPHCCIKPTKGRKRVPLCLGWTKAKKAKIKRPIFTWQMALNTGDTGMAVREAMEQAAELAGEGDTGEQPSAMAELEVHEATGQGQDGVAGRVLNTGGELLGGGCPDGHHCPGGKGCHHDQEGGLKLPRTEIGDEFLTDYSLDFCGSHPPATTGHDDSFAEQQSPDQEVIKVEPGVSSLGSARPFLDPSRHVATAMSLADPGNQAKMNSRSATSCHQPSEGGCLAEEAPTCPSEFYSPAWGAADLQQEKMGKTGDGGGRSKDVAENPDSTSPSPEDPRKPMPPVHQELEGCRRLSTPRTGQTDEEECGKNWAGDPSRPLQKLLESEAPEVADDKQDAMKAADAREKLFDPCKYGATGDPWISASAPTSRFAMQSSVGIIPTMPDLALGRIIAPCTDGYGQEDASAAEGADPTGMPMESTAEGQWGVHTAYPHPMPDADLLARELWCNWPQPSAGSQGKEENLPLGDPRADEPSISLKWVNGSVED